MKLGHLTRVKMVIIEEHEGEGRWCGRDARHFREAIWTIKELRNPGHSMLSEAS